jgi:predicted DsbA family dithiol-disulfide isomerase
MVEPKSKEELDKIRAEHPITIDVFTYSKCPHCISYKPEVEKACVSLRSVDKNGSIPVIHCPVDKDFCSEELAKTGVSGVPFTVARVNVPTSMFAVRGNNPKELNSSIDQLKMTIAKTEKAGEPLNHGKERRK